MDRLYEIDRALHELMPETHTWEDHCHDPEWLQAFPGGFQPLFSYSQRLVLCREQIMKTSEHLSDDDFLLYVENAIEWVMITGVAFMMNESTDHILQLHHDMLPDNSVRLEQVAHRNGMSMAQFMGMEQRPAAVSG
jgi:hypothetical protein